MMQNIFHNLMPMLLKPSAPFDSEDFIFEIKFDGIRCLSLIDCKNITLKTRNGRDITACFPELTQIYKCAEKPCILDGELVVLKDGKPDLYSILKRTAKIERHGSFALKAGFKSELTVEYAVFDMLFLDGADLTRLPLLTRKLLLKENIKEGNNLSLVRYIENRGTAFFNMIKERGLEGIVAKRKDSGYSCGKRENDWLKIKATTEEEFFVLGIIRNDDYQPVELILGVAEDGRLRPAAEINITTYKSVQKNVMDFAQKRATSQMNTEEENAVNLYFKNTKNAIRLEAGLKCKVEYLNKTESGRLRQPVFKGLII